MEVEKSVSIESNGNLIIRGNSKGTICIDTTNVNDIIAKLKELDCEGLDTLAQISDKEDLGEVFNDLLAGRIAQKNIVKGSISNIGRDVVIGDVRNYYIDTVLQAKKSKALTVNLPFLRQDQIIEREKELQDIRNRLFDNRQVLLVNGMGGIGKTTVAQVYLTECYDEYQYVAWVGLGLEDQDFKTSFINTEGLLDRFNIRKEGKAVGDLFIELLGQLNEIDEHPCLLVIDNATKELEQYYNYLPKQPNWHVLVTSREQISYFDSKELEFLDEDAAVALFKLHYKRTQLTDDFLKSLVKDLEYHTLTIEILAKTAQDKRTKPDILLRAIQSDLKTEVNGIRHSAGDTVDKVLSYLCSIFKINDLNEVEKWMLKQFVCLPPEFQTFDLLEELLLSEENKDIELPKLLSSLTNKGCLQYNENADSYKIHRIITDVILKSISITQEDIEVLVANINSKLSKDEVKGNPVDKFQWVPFGKSILLRCPDFVSPNIIELYTCLGIAFKDLGDLEEAKLLLEKVKLFFDKNFVGSHLIVANSYCNLAIVYQGLGDFKDAKFLLEKAVSIDERYYGGINPITGSHYSKLAMVLRDLGDYKKAKFLLEKVKIVYEQHFGEFDPATTVVYSDLSVVLSDLGDLVGAKLLAEKVKLWDESNFGEFHPYTANSYSNLASIYKFLGDYKRAKSLLEKAKYSNEQHFGEIHPTTAVCYSNLALVIRDLGDYEEAKLLLEKAVFSTEQYWGEDHPATAINYSNLSSVLQRLGDYEGAKLSQEKAKSSNERHFGMFHPTTASRYLSLVSILEYLKDYSGAIDLLKKTISNFKVNFGEDHPKTEMTKRHLEFIIRLSKK